jgi:hypothetical protein
MWTCASRTERIRSTTRSGRANGVGNCTLVAQRMFGATAVESSEDVYRSLRPAHPVDSVAD